MAYTETFITVSDDCPVAAAVRPVSLRTPAPAHIIQLELLEQSPYTFDHEALTFAVWARKQDLTEAEIAAQKDVLQAKLLEKGHPCLRASSLTKRYGYGAHYDAEGKIAVFPVESEAYQRLSIDPNIDQIPAMRNKRKK